MDASKNRLNWFEKTMIVVTALLFVYCVIVVHENYKLTKEIEEHRIEIDKMEIRIHRTLDRMQEYYENAIKLKNEELQKMYKLLLKIEAPIG